MSIWILTIGNSDVQLHTKEHWQQLIRNVRSQLGRGFAPTDGIDNRFLAPARVLGAVYSQPQAQEHWNDLAFPLLDNFIGQIHNEVIEKIILILTDQVNIFSPEERRPQHHPYWQDTCSLEALLTTYLKDKFPQAELIPLLLKPQSSNQGLDNWDYVLDLVDEKLRNLQIQGERIQTEKIDTVYVSHQAGTPAISSAVQFVSLAQFKNVKFLVSNEYDSSLTEVVPDSKYLRKLQREKAKKLLDRYDYSGVRDILGLTQTNSNNPEDKRIKYLLDAGEQWNFAEFQKFKKILVKRKLLSVNTFPWYQSGYESLYLAWVRLQQGNTVDALFHSFRAIEGSISKWAEKCYGSHIKKDEKYGPQLQLSICNELPNYLNALSSNMQKNFQKYRKLGLYGVQLYELLKQAKPEWQTHPDIKVVWEVAKDQRNNLFHRIEGLQELEVFEAWDTQTVDEWKKRILGCLNFIAKDDLPQEFTSLEEASLMSKVHEELEKAIASY